MGTHQGLDGTIRRKALAQVLDSSWRTKPVEGVVPTDSDPVVGPLIDTLQLVLDSDRERDFSHLVPAKGAAQTHVGAKQWPAAEQAAGCWLLCACTDNVF